MARTVEEMLTDALGKIQVSKTELTEARRRRGLLIAALKRTFPGSDGFGSGSVTHGDAIEPLSDVDLDVEVFGVDTLYGPGKAGPRGLMEAARVGIREGLGGEFENMRVTAPGPTMSSRGPCGSSSTGGDTMETPSSPGISRSWRRRPSGGTWGWPRRSPSSTTTPTTP